MCWVSERVWGTDNHMQLFRSGKCIKKKFLMRWRSTVITFSHNEEGWHSEFTRFGEQIIVHPVKHVRPLQPFDPPRHGFAFGFSPSRSFPFLQTSLVLFSFHAELPGHHC